MERRSFLKASALIAALGAMTPLKSVNAFAGKIMDDGQAFSLEAIVSDADYAEKLIEQFAKENLSTFKTLKYSEIPIQGSTSGDLVFVKNNSLINFTNANDDASLELSEIRKKLLLPRVIENPVRIRLYTENNSIAKNFVVVQNGKIAAKINSESSSSYNFYGKTGKIVLNISEGKAQITESGCAHGVCMKRGSINKSGEYIACIPNQFQVFAE